MTVFAQRAIRAAMKSVSQGNERLDFIDAGRGLAIVLALAAHAVQAFVIYRNDFGIVLRTAMPTLLVVFGAMIEIAYLSRLRTGRAKAAARQRMGARVVACMAGFALITLTEYFHDDRGLTRVIQSLFFLEIGRFGYILAYYAAWLLLAMAFLEPLLRWGAKGVIAAALGAWAISFAAMWAGLPDQYTLHWILGYGDVFGPGLLLALTFLSAGMLLGEALTGRGGWWPVWIVVALAVLTIGIDLVVSPRDYVGKLSGLYRRLNHPVYYAYGILAAFVWLALLARIDGWLRGGPQGAAAQTVRFGYRHLVLAGRQALFWYVAGNTALNFIPPFWHGPALGYLYAIAFMALLWVLSVDRARERSVIRWLSGGLFVALGAFWRAQVARAGTWLANRMPAIGS
ncbi:MAG: hypothetical protein AAF371_04460 [Pseudomonadota bacterium]